MQQGEIFKSSLVIYPMQMAFYRLFSTTKIHGFDLEPCFLIFLEAAKARSKEPQGKAPVVRFECWYICPLGGIAAGTEHLKILVPLIN